MGTCSSFLMRRGYVNVVSEAVPTYNYVYQYKDHLGNNRLSYATTTQASQTQLTILEESHYYPFGLKHAPYNNNQYQFIPPANGNNVALLPAGQTGNYQYKYNGKEYQDELGLNVYDFGLRQYDPAIGRWTSQDPVIHFEYSPYNAFDNNPVFWSDPSGADSEKPEPTSRDRLVDDFGNLPGNRIASNGGEENDDYFDKKTGKYLGRGGTDEIRFIDEKDFKAGKLDKYTTSGKTITDQAAEAVVMYYSQFTDKKITNPYKVSITNELSTSFDPKTGELTFNFYKRVLGDWFKNRYDLINLWEHEVVQHGSDHVNLWKTQKMRYKDLGESERENWERKALTHQIKTSSWTKTSLDFKGHLSYWYGYLLSPNVYHKYFKQVVNNK